MAIKSLAILIRLQKQKIDTLRREVSDLQDVIHQLETAREQLQETYRKELETVSLDPELGGFVGGYSHYVKERTVALGEEIKRLVAILEAKREEMATEFAEQKKYEIAMENEAKKQDVIEKRQELQVLDEIATRQYNDKSNE